jgi:hypothetical protein
LKVGCILEGTILRSVSKIRSREAGWGNMTEAKGKAQSNDVYADTIRFGVDLAVMQRTENLFAEAMRAS